VTYLLAHPECGDDVDDLLVFWNDVNQEDIGIVERVQVGLGNPLYTGGRMCYRFEESVHRFQNMVIDRMLGIRRVPEGDAETQRPMFA
jgi:choline monooxygenase